MTTTIETLEVRTEQAIRAILRRTMRDVTTITDYDHAVARIEQVGWQQMHDNIATNYAAGYIAAGELVRKGLRTAAITPTEDPLIAQHTTRLIYGLEQVANNQRNEIQAALRTLYEKGATATQISTRMERFFDDNRVAATRFARTATNDIYNSAHLARYEQSGVVDGVQYSAFIDTRTSDICRVLDQTIWALDDPGIQTPPSHFNCRSRIQPYFGKIPGKRDYSKQFSPAMLASARKTQETFRSTYWTPAPHTKASAMFQRSYFGKRDILTIRDGLNITRRTNRDPVGIDLLKKRLRYRKIDPDGTTIVDAFGKGVLIDKFERRQIKDAINALIAAAMARRERLLKKGLGTLASAESTKIAGYEEMTDRFS